MIRKPVISILGHVDHGKTKLLDTIRQTTVVDREAGAITQAIGASIVPLETIQRLCGDLLKKLNLAIKFPGLLFIDTPGHAAFTNLRKRGGNLADIAILVIDINEGFKPQTIEAIEILKKYKTPFVVAANKVDLISGWQKKDMPLMQSINSQNETTVILLETKLYELVTKFEEMEVKTERFDRVEDYTKEIAIVPMCAKTAEGIPELLMVMTGLVQKYLEESLNIEVEGPGKGTILEIKEEQGLGKTLDVIIYDGTIKVNDTIVIGGIDAPIVTKVRALFEPAPLSEMREKKSKFTSVKEVHAATGVKLSAPNVEEVIAGMPVCVVDNNEEELKEKIQQEVEEVLIETDRDGIIIKAESLGSVEAMVTILKDKGVPIRKAGIGNITKKDISDAQANYDKNPLHAILLGFNVIMTKDAEENLKGTNVTTLTNKVIYRLVEDYDAWEAAAKKKLEAAGLDELTRPCKMQIMQNHVFRQSGPAIVGMDVMVGKIKTGTRLIKEGQTKPITKIKSMKEEKDNINEAEAPKQLAIALDGVTIGRQLNEGDILYPFIIESEFRQLKKFAKFLKKEEIQVLKEYAEMMRKDNPVWGV
jgi:translation initiation factor 5B